MHGWNVRCWIRMSIGEGNESEDLLHERIDWLFVGKQQWIIYDRCCLVAVVDCDVDLKRRLGMEKHLTL